MKAYMSRGQAGEYSIPAFSGEYTPEIEARAILRESEPGTHATAHHSVGLVRGSKREALAESLAAFVALELE